MAASRRNSLIAIFQFARAVLVSAFLLATSNNAFSQPIIFWELNGENLARVGSTVQLRDKEEQIVTSLPTSQLRKLHNVKEKIGLSSGLSDVVLVISSDEKPNAFAGAKDGRRGIAFTLGMLRLLGEDDDMMAAVMGHEFGHHAKNHQGRGERQAAAEVVGLLVGLIAGRTFANRLAADLAARAGDLGGRAIIHSYDRDQEREADAFGVDVMARAGYDPQAAVRYWQLMSGKGGGGVFSTHPATSERLENIRVLANSQTMYAAARRERRQPQEGVRRGELSSDASIRPVAIPKADPKIIESIFVCLAPGLPQDWKKTWFVITNVERGITEEREFDAKFYYTITSLDSDRLELVPCNLQEIARRISVLSDSLPPERRAWSSARFVIDSNGDYELKYDYGK